MHILNVPVDEETLKRLEALGLKTQRSIEDVAREGIEVYTHQQDELAELDALIDQVMEEEAELLNRLVD